MLCIQMLEACWVLAVEAEECQFYCADMLGTGCLTFWAQGTAQHDSPVRLKLFWRHSARHRTQQRLTTPYFFAL